MDRILKPVLLVIQFINKRRYLLLSTGILCLLCIKVNNGFWVSDFWLHSAVIREFSLNPFSPTNPFLPVSSQHFYHGPYHWLVGCFARLFGLSSITALAYMGLFNFIIFSSSLNLFCRKLKTSPHTAFYALLFSLVLWGKDPWLWSSFFHLQTIGYCFPYPSFFSIGLTILSFSVLIENLNKNKKYYFLHIIPLSSIVTLSHTSTSIVLFIGLGIITISYSSKKTIIKNFINILLIIILTFSLVFLWPYLSLLALFSQKANFVSHYIIDDLALYKGVIGKIWPTLFAVPLIFIRLYRNPKDALGLLALGFSAVYLWGFLTEKWSYGRSIAQTILIVHIIFADWFASIKTRKEIPLYIRYFVFSFIFILLFICIVNIPSNLFKEYVIKKNKEYDNLYFISELTNRNDVILTDRYSGNLVPSFGGKVVGYNLLYKGQEPFVSDAEDRIRDMEHFFDENTSRFDREKILKKYKVDFVLINKNITPLNPSLADFLKDTGEIVYHKNEYLLVSLNKNQE